MHDDKNFPPVFSRVIDIRISSALNTPAHLLAALKNSAMSGQIEVFNSTANNPIAYVAWANVNKESFLMMSKTKQMPPFFYEWNEGKLMVIYDVVFLPKWGTLAKAELLNFLLQKRFVAFLKRGRLHLWTKGSRPKRRLL